MFYVMVFFFGLAVGMFVFTKIDSYEDSKHTSKLYGIPFKDKKGTWRFSIAESVSMGKLNSVAVSSIEDRYTTPEEVMEMMECIKRMKIIEPDSKDLD